MSDAGDSTPGNAGEMPEESDPTALNPTFGNTGEGAYETDPTSLNPTFSNAGDGPWKPLPSTALKADWSNPGLEKFDQNPQRLDPDWGNAGLKLNGSISTQLTAPPSQAGLRLNTNIGINVFFTVTIDTLDLGAWSKCTGLGMKLSVVDRDESGMTLFQHHLPGHLEYDRITLERPLTRDCQSVMAWITAYHMLPIATSGQITCLDQTGTPIVTWEMSGVTPVSWKGPTFDATSGTNVATEQLTFAHAGFL